MYYFSTGWSLVLAAAILFYCRIPSPRINSVVFKCCLSWREMKSGMAHKQAQKNSWRLFSFCNQCNDILELNLNWSWTGATLPQVLLKVEIFRQANFLLFTTTTFLVNASFPHNLHSMHHHRRLLCTCNMRSTHHD